MSKQSPFLEIQALASDMWNEHKGLGWTENIREKKVLAKRIKSYLKKIKELDWEKEFEWLDQLHFDGETVFGEPVTTNAIFTYEDMMDIAGWMAAADPKRPVSELKYEAEVYIKNKLAARQC